jgi:hypothetical protein
MKRLIAAVAATLALAGGVAQAAEACTNGSSYESYAYCTSNPGAILITYTCTDGHIYRATNWRVLWGCGG